VMIHQILADGHDVSIVETNRRGHATRYAQDAATRGLDVVVALGGDGTLNEVVTGLAGSATAVAVLPGGSTNVFARTIGLPNDPVAAARLLADALTASSIRRVGLGSVNGRYFTFHTGVGFDAAVVAAVEKRASVKRWFGHPLFVWAGMSTWAVGYDRRHPHFTVTIDGGEPVADGMFTIVMNTNPYTFLGERPLDLVPGTGLDTPLSVVTFRKLTFGSLVPALAKALRGGGLPTDSPNLQVKWGAAGYEYDRVEFELGSPGTTLLLASSVRFNQSHQAMIAEELYFMQGRDGAGVRDPQVPGQPHRFSRSDIAYLEYPNGGAVFSAGAICWRASLSAYDYGNTVSRVTENVLRRFADGSWRR